MFGRYLRKPVIFILIFVLVFGSIVFTLPRTAQAYPAFSPFPDKVRVAPYDRNATAGAGNWGKNTGPSTRDFITIGHRYRIRQDGTLARIRIYTACTTNMSAFYLKVWRKDAGNLYDLVGTSENLIASLVPAGYSAIDLSSAVSGVQEGDYIGYRVETTAAGCGGGQFVALTAQTGVTSYYATDVTPSSTDYNWAGQTAGAGVALPIELYMQAPQVVGIGDSIMSGAPNHRAYLVDSPPAPDSNPPTTILGSLKTLTNYIYQNMGIGSQTTTNISARFSSDVIALKPRVILIEGGVNDIAGGASKATFLANWTTMLTAAQAENNVSRIIVLKILPWTNGTLSQMQTRDDWNSSLVTLAGNYTKAVVVDASTYVGQFRAGGDVGNLWDIQPAYNADGVHFVQTGHAQIAQAIADTIDSFPVDNQAPTISSLSPADNATEVSVVDNLVINFNEEVIPQAGAQNDIVIKKSNDNSTVETIDAESAQITGGGTSTITINPSIDFDANTSYYVQIGVDAFNDFSDNSFAGITTTSTWNFQTITDLVDGFGYRKAITIDNGNIGATLTDFPLYIRITADADIGSVVRNDGYDIRFASSDLLRLLSYERESWSGGGGGAASGDFWVKTTLNADADPSTDDIIYIYYGKSTAGDEQGVAGAWNSGYAGVWHLDEDVTDEETQVDVHRDSTGFLHHGTQNGNVDITAQISNGQDFDGVNDNISISQGYSSQDITVSWWSNCGIASPTAEGIFDVNRGATDRLFAYHWNYSGNNGLYVSYFDTSTATYYNRLLDVSITQADWHYYSASWVEATKTFILYKDGVAQSTTTGGVPTLPTGASTRLGVGSALNFGDVNIDELRISSIARPLAWLEFEYLNMVQADHGLSWADQEDMIPEPPPGVIPTPNPTPTPTPTPTPSLEEDIYENIVNTIRYYSNTPYVSFSFPSDSVSGSVVTFDASSSFSTNGIVKYEWNFGDGNTETSTSPRISHSYEEPGRYTVTLTVTDSAGRQNSISKTIDIKPAAPEITNIEARDASLWIEGKSDPDTIIHFTIHSNPFEGQGLADKKGYWTYLLDNASDVLGEGDHTIVAKAAVKLSDNTELTGAESKTYDFKVSFDNGKLKVEMKKTRTWQYISLGLLLIIVAGFVLIRVRKRRRI